MFSGNQVVELLSFRKRNATIIHAFKLFSHIAHRSAAKTSSTFAPYGNITFFAPFAVFTGKCIDRHLFLSLQTHHRFRQIHLYFATLHIYRNNFIRRISFHIKASSQNPYIKTGGPDNKRLLFVSLNLEISFAFQFYLPFIFYKTVRVANTGTGI